MELFEEMFIIFVTLAVRSVAIHGEFYLNEKYKLQVLVVYYETDPRTRSTILCLIVKIKVWINIGYIYFIVLLIRHFKDDSEFPILIDCVCAVMLCALIW